MSSTDSTQTTSPVVQHTSVSPASPLQYVWKLHYISPISKQLQAWCPVYVSTFSTISQFWAVFNGIAPPTMLHVGTSLLLVKDKIEPRGEAESNSSGGRLSVGIPLTSYDLMDNAWIHTVMAVIGEYFSSSESLNACVCDVKSGYLRISLWIKDANDQEAIETIKKEWALNLKISGKIQFYPFSLLSQ